MTYRVYVSDNGDKYWKLKFMNTSGKFYSICDMFSSKFPCSDEDQNEASITNKTCKAACINDEEADGNGANI